MDRGYSLLELLVTLLVAGLVLGVTLPSVGTDAHTRDALLQELSKPIPMPPAPVAESEDASVLPVVVARLMSARGSIPPGVSSVAASLKGMLRPDGRSAPAVQVGWGVGSRRPPAVELVQS